jgi:hypothetical protein
MNAVASEAVAETDRCSAGKPGDVLAVDIAAAKALLAAIPVRETETLSLLEASGRINAADKYPLIDLLAWLPPFRSGGRSSRRDAHPSRRT